MTDVPAYRPRVVVGLDLSLTRTGVTRIICEPDPAARPRITCRSVTARVRQVKKGDEPHTVAERSARVRRLTGDTTALCAGADLVVVEGPSYASDTGKAHDRAGYWWLVVARLTGAGLHVVEVPPSALKMYALGKGGGAGAGKDDVLAAVVRRYHDVEFSGNDEADSLVLAAMGARFIGQPVDDPPATHTRAMKSVRWTPNTTR